MRSVAIGMLSLICLGTGTDCSDAVTQSEPLADLQMPPAASDLGEKGTSADFYADTSVIEIELTFAEAEWTQLMAYHRAGKKEFVHCGVAFRGTQFPDAACRPKGRPSGWVDEPKPQLVVAFDRWDNKGRFLGLRRINLEAVPYHPAPVRDRIGMWLMHKAGLQAPRVNHARVNKNGQYYGLYMNIEHIDKEFLERHFENPTGNLYADGYMLETNKTENNYQRLWDLNDLVIAEPLAGDHSAFFARLTALLDLRTMLRMTAAEVVLPTSDNWSNGSANYYYYDDPFSHRFVHLPWDLDTFLTSFSPPTAAIYNFWGIPGNENPPNKMLQLVYQNPLWKREFEDQLIALREGPYREMPAQVTAVCQQIRPYVATDPHRIGSIEDLDRDCQDIKNGIAARIQYIKTVLGR